MLGLKSRYHDKGGYMPPPTSDVMDEIKRLGRALMKMANASPLVRKMIKATVLLLFVCDVDCTLTKSDIYIT